MADTQVLGTCASACGFKSRLPHQKANSGSLGKLSMAKNSPAKVKKLRAEAMRAAAARKAAKASSRCEVTNGEVDLDAYAAVDGNWRELGISAPARRALIDEGYYKLSDLRKTSLDEIKSLHGMGPNAIRILVNEMKKKDLSFRK